MKNYDSWDDIPFVSSCYTLDCNFDSKYEFTSREIKSQSLKESRKKFIYIYDFF